jgi:hypothetical protein
MRVCQKPSLRSSNTAVVADPVLQLDTGSPIQAMRFMGTVTVPSALQMTLSSEAKVVNASPRHIKCNHSGGAPGDAMVAVAPPLPFATKDESFSKPRARPGSS